MVPAGEATATSGGLRVSDVFSLLFIGWFVGLMLGGAVHNGLGAYTPLRVERGSVDRLEVDYSGTSTNGSTRRPSYVLHGRTAGGEPWRIVDEDAYRAVEREGYPQTVEVGIGSWTGNAERVEGATWSADQQSTGSRVFFGAMFGLLTLGGLATVVLLGRSRRYGLVGALVFAVAYFVLGSFTGEAVFGWFQSA